MERKDMETTEEYLSNLAGKKNVFKVPADYFESLHSRVMSRITDSSEIETFGISSADFSEITDSNSVLDSVLSVDELEAEKLIANLSTLGIDSVFPSEIFNIPIDYFQKLPDSITSKIALIHGLETSIVEQNKVEIREVKLIQEITKDQEVTKIQSITRPNSKGSIVFQWTNPLMRFAAAASVVGLLVFTGLEIKTTIENKVEYAKVAPEDRFLNRYDIDESVVEEELVSPVDATNVDSLNTRLRDDKKHVSGKDHEKSDSYILEHADEHTLVEEI